MTATEHVYPIQVERPAARQLAERLYGLFDAHRASLVENHNSHLTFVDHPQAYCGLHNSNQMAAEWLLAMGRPDARLRRVRRLAGQQLRRLFRRSDEPRA